MESKKLSLGVNSLFYGAILGVLLIIFDLLFYIFDAPLDSKLKYLNVLIIIGLIIFGTISFRNKNGNGYINYGRSFLSCFLIALYGGVLFAVYEYLFVKFFDPSIIEKVQEFAREKIMEKTSISEDKVDEIMEMQKWFYTPAFFGLSAILSSTLWGVIFSLIVSIFIKKEDKSFEGAMSNSNE